MQQTPYAAVTAGQYVMANHYYPRVPNAQLHPMVGFFLQLGNDRIAARFSHLHPEVKPAAIQQVLATPPAHFRWSGADLFHVTDDRGRRRFVVIETNSSPSGQKSMPLLDPYAEQGGYRTLMERTFLPMTRRRSLPKGDVAILWDKNWMEVSGYATALADLLDEPIHLVQVTDDNDPALRNDNGVLNVRTPSGWVPLRAAFRYITQRPWTRLPAITRTAVLNPVVACLAGGRNKSLAAIAYDLYNADLAGTGLAIRMPETIPNVGLQELPLHLQRMGGIAMVKVPYSNAGQGVDAITCKADLDLYMKRSHPYSRFLVQGLIGNAKWSSLTRDGHLYQVGTIPTAKGELFVADLRFMVGANRDGFYPLALYSRRAPAPLADDLATSPHTPWEMLGTNLSKRTDDGGFTTEPDRLLLMDQRDFNQLGIGIDDLVEAYVQTVLSTIAIDRMAERLITQKGRFRRKLFESLVNDPELMKEIPE
jgi:hypothetical protein